MTDSFDEAVMKWISDHRTDFLDSVTTHAMDLAVNYVVLGAVAAVAMGMLAWLLGWRAGVAVAVAAYLGGTIGAQLKQVFDRPRPPPEFSIVHMYDSAMPSSHASMTAAAAVTLLCAATWASRRQFAAVAVVLAMGLLVTAASMVYLGGHWPTDILAGWALGGAIGAAVAWVARRFIARSRPAAA